MKRTQPNVAYFEDNTMGPCAKEIHLASKTEKKQGNRFSPRTCRIKITLLTPLL